MENKPECELIGESGNIYALVGAASRALKRADMREKAEEMKGRVQESQSYDEALQIIMEYVEVI